VEGKLLVTVSYVDHENNLQMKSVEPYVIRSVCDLLKPLDKTPEAFEKLIIGMDSTSEKMNLDWNPQVIFRKAQKLRPIKNFHVIDSDERTIGGHFTGTIRGFAEGKYTGKKVAVQALISGSIEGNQSEVVIEGMGEDIAMLPTTVEEISVGIGSWICMNCGAAIDVDGVTKIKQKVPISCQYCRQTLTIDLYRK
jgi:DNA-directed RNA polymerase subunit RPC12/RpoP